MNPKFGVTSLLISALLLAGCYASSIQQESQTDQQENKKSEQVKTADSQPKTDKKKQKEKKVEIATFGAGCFWCVEAVFQRLDGVEKVEPGYCNGEIADPTYKQVCTGLTGHAEVCRITYDANKITFAELLEVFWKTHDPTTLNQQGADRGTQYRSAVFYHNDEQKELATKYKKRLDDAEVFNSKIVTEITEAEKFYIAEDYHKNYFNDNPNQGYCRAVIVPKIEKFKKAFADKLKK